MVAAAPALLSQQSSGPLALACVSFQQAFSGLAIQREGGPAFAQPYHGTRHEEEFPLGHGFHGAPREEQRRRKQAEREEDRQPEAALADRQEQATAVVHRQD